jgi:hypothetical protein
MARELGLSDLTVRKKVLQDIYYKSYAFRRGYFMNPATKKRRLAKAKLLLTRLKAPAGHGQLVFVSDEKNFPQDQKINRKK